MRKTWKQWFAVLAAGMMAFSMTSCQDLPGKLAGLFGNDSVSEEKADPAIILENVTKAKNVILMIGDGMGPTQIEAGSLYRNAPLTMQKFPYMTTVETRSASNAVTDSAAAATAFATGTRTANGKVGLDVESNKLETIVDIAHGLGKRTGVIATEELSGATPMGFSGHADVRTDLRSG